MQRLWERGFYLSRRALQAPGTRDKTTEDVPNHENARSIDGEDAELGQVKDKEAGEDLNATVESTHDVRVTVADATALTDTGLTAGASSRALLSVAGASSRALLSGELSTQGQDDPKKKRNKKKTKGQQKQTTEG